jgi:hypothetical protein
MPTNKGYQLPDKILKQLGEFDRIVTNYDPNLYLNGRVLAHCMKKDDEPTIEQFKMHQEGLLVVNTRPESLQFQDLLECAHSVLFLKGRVRFMDMQYNTIIPSNAPYGTAIFSFKESETLILQKANLMGKVVMLNSAIPEFA